MQYCNHCGKELIDDAEVCTGCGCRVVKQSTKKEKLIKGKGLGFLLSFFLGVIGFLIAMFWGDEECEKTAIITFVIHFIITVVLTVIYLVLLGSTFSIYH